MSYNKITFNQSWVEFDSFYTILGRRNCIVPITITYMHTCTINTITERFIMCLTSTTGVTCLKQNTMHAKCYILLWFPNANATFNKNHLILLVQLSWRMNSLHLSDKWSLCALLCILIKHHWDNNWNKECIVTDWFFCDIHWHFLTGEGWMKLSINQSPNDTASWLRNSAAQCGGQIGS